MRNLKRIFTALAFAFLCAWQAPARIGIGAQAGINLGEPDFIFFSATVKSTKSPWAFSLDADIGSMQFALNADDWFIHKDLAYPLSGFVFWGISGTLQIKDDFHIGTGARLGAGLSLLLFGHLEIYAQGAWNPSLGIECSDRIRLMLRPLCFPVSSGARFYF